MRKLMRNGAALRRIAEKILEDLAELKAEAKR